MVFCVRVALLSCHVCVAVPFLCSFFLPIILLISSRPLPPLSVFLSFSHQGPYLGAYYLPSSFYVSLVTSCACSSPVLSCSIIAVDGDPIHGFFLIAYPHGIVVSHNLSMYPLLFSSAICCVFSNTSQGFILFRSSALLRLGPSTSRFRP